MHLLAAEQLSLAETESFEDRFDGQLMPSQQSKLVTVQVTTDQLASLMKGPQLNVTEHSRPSTSVFFMRCLKQSTSKIPAAPVIAYKLDTLGQIVHDTIAPATLAFPSPQASSLRLNIQRGY